MVAGQVARDLVLKVEQLPDEGSSADVVERLEMLGGAANQAVGCRQLGWSAGLVGVVGDDDAGRALLAAAGADDLDVAGVRIRQGGTTALYVDVVEAGGARRIFDHVPANVLLTAADIVAAEPMLSAARAVLIQLQQPSEAVLAAIDIAARGDALVVVDGFPEDSRVLETVLSSADVIRADAAEAPTLVGRELSGVADTVSAATSLAADSSAVVALAAEGAANVLAWQGGHVVLPLIPGTTVDATGGGDAFLAALVSALLLGADPETAGWEASAAAALTVGRLGGRPQLDARRVSDLARESRREAT